MKGFWTCHWRFRFWRPDINREGHPVSLSGSNNFRKRGVSVGDTVYIISLSDGHLYLGGRMTVKQIVSRSEAAKLWNDENLYDAREWIIDPEETGSTLHLHRRLSPTVTKQLRFLSGSSRKEPCFISDTELDNQATRGVRQLSPESAALFDRIIAVTDRMPNDGEIITVTEDLLQDITALGPERSAGKRFTMPEEVDSSEPFYEGAVRRIVVNAYERNSEAREKCIIHYGCHCAVCGIILANKYGEAAEGLIHVHHIIQLAEIKTQYQVDPVEDLRPVCPTCHAVIHTRRPAFTIEEVQEMIRNQKQDNANKALHMTRAGAGL